MDRHTDDGPAADRRTEPGSGPYRIEIAGRAGGRVLRPLVDDFRIEQRGDRTLLRGRVRDAAHLHGVVTRLTALGVTIIAFGPDAGLDPTTPGDVGCDR